jgi:hypothetical protein
MKNEEVIKYLEQHGYIDDVVKDICIAAIEKTTPKKVDNLEVAVDVYGDCPCCGESYHLEKHSLIKCCAECGQKFDWSDVVH